MVRGKRFNVQRVQEEIFFFYNLNLVSKERKEAGKIG